MTRFKATPILFAAAAALLLLAATPAPAQAPSSGPPLPRMVAPDEAGIDLLNGRRVGTDSAISIGPADAPTLEVSEGGGGLDGTPLGGFHYVDGSHPNYSDYFVLGSRGESNGYSDGTARPLPDGMIWTGIAILERDGTRWNFASTGATHPYPTQYLTSLVRADGETLTYNYSSIPSTGDIRGRLRSITSSAGYQINVEWTPESSSHRLTQVRLTNRRSAYCDPQNGACMGSHDWPTLSWSTDSAFNVTANTSGLRNVVYGVRQQGAQIGTIMGYPVFEGTRQVTTGGGVTRTYTERYSALTPPALPLYYGRQTNLTCMDAALIWRVQDPAGTWNYNYGNSCQGGGLGSATRTDPLGRQAGRNGTTFTDELGRTTTYAYIDRWGDPATLGDLRKVVNQTLPEGNQISWNYGSQYSPQNLLGVTVTPKPGSGSPTLSWQLAYPSGCTLITTINCHRPLYEIDQAGNRTDYSYDSVHGGVLT
ncbi:MAG TPA: hypothetical protein VF689_04235, partial [Allosphingosinicella sp.]